MSTRFRACYLLNQLVMSPLKVSIQRPQIFFRVVKMREGFRR